jgi:hypothetical protein
MNHKLMLRVGYTELVMDSENAWKVFDALTKANVLRKDTRYVKDEAGKSTGVDYVEPYSGKIALCGVDAAEFAMWKLAGENNE